MSIGLVAKLALVTAMAIASVIAPVEQADGACPYRDAFSCCVYACQHDSSTGCTGGVRCCENLCR